ncbi:MAG: hypothetical protein ACTHMI_08830 [Mucilaginibacter sp.]|uniref:hypothetical protein n=1 Tax=Mucilaginibacter sp. L3T2-6 TaxID=3062491 RepID=UPI0026764544|nr:hypothetical protein [Mucilaginibacter sp. L3T2-6]MDO3644902.1 hypothetical protein [Mucilaginibacter sp. L3T2-6]MDV6217353.1 hypothetical protein [Mucilaginibacter sp. L3T2-6]
MKTKAKVMAMFKIWLVIYPSITLLSFLIGPQLTDLPLPARNLVLTVILVPWMILAGLPLLESAIKLLAPKKQ